MSKHTANGTRWRDRFKSAVTLPGDPAEPLWVRAFTDLGRPAVAVTVMVMCAPGEHKIGLMAGWSSRLAWGMAAVLAAYAGIAAVVAGRRRKGSPGRVTANLGAGVALAAGMAAQPIAHLYVTGVWVADPHDQVWLIVGASCVPALVLAHLLHLAASHRPVPAAVDSELPIATPAATPAATAPATVPATVPAIPVWVTISEAATLTGRAESTVRGWLTDPARGLVVHPMGDAKGRTLIDAASLPTVQLQIAAAP